MSKVFILNMKLKSIRTFLNRVCESVDREYFAIIQRSEAGEFNDEDEEMNTFFDPMMSEEIGIRAVYHELNALIESELQSLASAPFAEQEHTSKRKRKRIIWDLRRKELSELIESYYAVSFDDLPGSGQIEDIRRTVNSYKHRSGFKDPRKWTDRPMTSFPERFKLERETACQCIDATRDFFQSLWKSSSSVSNAQRQ